MSKKHDYRPGPLDCPLCGYQHFDVAVYVDWLHRFPVGPRGGGKEQRGRWQAIVDRHAREGP